MISRSKLLGRCVLVGLFVFFLLANTIYLNDIPGLMGDEGSEGQNVYELLTARKITVQGERSYIGVWIDFVRTPFVSVLGYSALALRIPVLLSSIVVFWVTFFVIRKIFGESSALFGVVFLTFSPVFLTEQRMGWAISLLPMFACLMIYFSVQNKKWSPILLGLAAGLGLNTHIIFMATLLAILAIMVPYSVYILLRNFTKDRLKHLVESTIMFAIAFWSGFSVQFANLVLFSNDQGNPAESVSHFWDRLQALPTFIFPVLSGSVFMARYTGELLAENISTVIVYILMACVILGIAISKKRKYLFVWLLGLVIQIICLTYIIEYFALRYFVVFALGFWLLAGVSLGSIFDRFSFRKASYIGSALLSFYLVYFSFVNVFMPFSITGGSTKTYDFGTRTESSEALVDIRPLLSCIANKENVFSDSIHIRNRLEYLSKSNEAIKPSPGLGLAKWFIVYRKEKTLARNDELCPNLRNFRVVPYDKNKDKE